MPYDSIENLLKRWQSGELDLGRLELELRSVVAATSPTPDVQVDIDRLHRCGFPEVVFGTGKTPEAVLSVFQMQRAAGQNSLATRMSLEQAESVQREFPTAVFNPIARTLTQINSPSDRHGRVIVVSAGTSDRPVAEEESFGTAAVRPVTAATSVTGPTAGVPSVLWRVASGSCFSTTVT